MDNKDIVKEYRTKEITVVWKPGICIHAANCLNSLPHVYQPDKSPWIMVENATTEELIKQINTCPSGALSYKLSYEKEIAVTKNRTMENSKVAGKSPMMVDLEVGINYAWCACGHSSNQPWCDGSHKGSGITPVVFKLDENKKVAMCMCKQTANSPHCDGSHNNIV